MEKYHHIYNSKTNKYHTTHIPDRLEAGRIIHRIEKSKDFDSAKNLKIVSHKEYLASQKRGLQKFSNSISTNEPKNDFPNFDNLVKTIRHGQTCIPNSDLVIGKNSMTFRKGDKKINIAMNKYNKSKIHMYEKSNKEAVMFVGKNEVGMYNSIMSKVKNFFK